MATQQKTTLTNPTGLIQQVCTSSDDDCEPPLTTDPDVTLVDTPSVRDNTK